MMILGSSGAFWVSFWDEISFFDFNGAIKECVSPVVSPHRWCTRINGTNPYVYMFIYVCMYIYVCVRACIRACTCAHVCICVVVDVCVDRYVCMCGLFVHTHVRIYVHVGMHAPRPTT